MKNNSPKKHSNHLPQHTQSQSVKNISKQSGALYLVATPIGNLGDISARAIETLKSCDFILAEDTRIGRKLLTAFGISKPIRRADEEATEKIIPFIIDEISAGKNIALISDAGTPCISDPGQRLARAVIDNGFEVYPIPGAASPIVALVASGLDSKQFAFLGFIPNKQKARREFFEKYASLDLTLIFFETGPRLIDSLGDICAVFGNRNIAVTRELTKLYEEKRRGLVAEVLQYYQEKGAPKGEIVIVIEGAKNEISYDDEDIANLIKQSLGKMPMKELSAQIAKITGRKSREIYEMALGLKDGE